jgi:hypothetical protein
MYQWLVFLHILGALLFFMAHGGSAMMAFMLRREQNVDRMRALLEMSGIAVNVMYGGLLILLIGGIGAGFMGNWWSQGWIGVSLVLLIILVAWMGYYSQTRYAPLRKALGITYRGQPGDSTPPSQQQLEALVQAANPVLLAVTGLGGGAVILWLMVFKPF